MSDERVTATIRGIDAELKRVMDAHDLTNGEFVNTAGWEKVGGKSKSALDTRVKHKEERVSQIKREIRDLEDELSEEQAELEALKVKREEAVADNTEQKRRLLTKLKQVPDDPDHPLVQEVADQLDMTPEQAIEGAKEL